MEDTAIAPSAPPRRVIELDPFDFFPNRRSALGGFGGDDGRTDPNYAFHTQYQGTAPGRITFTVRLGELQAMTGTLVLRVLALPADSNAIEPTVANTAQVALRTIAERGGEVSIAVRATKDMLYALAGLVVDETDAILSAVTITLDRLDHGETDASGMAADEQTRFGVTTLQPIPMLLTSEPPTLVLPVSQVRTPEQRDDPNYERWARALGIEEDDQTWARVYILRVLESYGVLARGARGLLLGLPDAEMARIVADNGCTITDYLPRYLPEPGPPKIPETYRGFDFLWTRGLLNTHATIYDGLHMVEQGLACLNVGGVAVHVFKFVADADVAGEDVPGSLVYTRADMERLAFHLIASNHEVAQFSYGLQTGVKPRPTHFGLAIRKGSF